jgi:protein-S-isoprenylcysteine O-methyltransferase Ste14
MPKLFAALYGGVAYLMFFVTILYMICFTGDFLVPKTVNTGVFSDPLTALAINLALVLLFALQHTVMARARFKTWITQYVPAAIERSTFVLFASLLLLLLFWQWRPIAGTVWQIESALGRSLLYSLFAAGWIMVFGSSFLINHFDLFGLRQVYLYCKDQKYFPVKFRAASLYRFVRNPLMLGFIIAVWATPHMTVGHFVFAAAISAYTLIGIQFEERSLLKHLGKDYRLYREQTPMILPVPNLTGKGAYAWHYLWLRRYRRPTRSS